MIRGTKRAQILYRISLIAVISALVMIGVFQYRWMSRSAEAELERLSRDLNMTIYRSISQEFQLLTFLQDIRVPRDTEMNPQEIEKKIEDIITQWGVSGGSGLLYSTAYAPLEDADNLQELRILEEGWRQSVPLPDEIIEEIRQQRKPDLWIEIFPSRNPEENSIYIIKVVGNQQKYLVIFRFAPEVFFKSIVQPSLVALLPDYDLIWYEKDAGEANFSDPSFWGQRYRFSPLKSLFLTEKQTPGEWLIPVPYFVAQFPDRERPEEEENNPFPLLRFWDAGKEDFDFQRYIYGFIDVQKDGVPVIQQREMELALNWLMSLLLLCGIGIAYVFIIYQVSRLHRLRAREREFVAGVTHELRTPLTVIQSAADNLKKGIVPPDRLVKYGEFIEKHALRLGDMIEGILLFSRLEGDAENQPPVKKVSFKELKDSLLSSIDPFSESDSSSIIIDFGGLPETALLDRDSFTLILGNLLSNALHHGYLNRENSGKGPVRVYGRLRLPSHLIFYVEDDGIGISPSDKRRLFNPFYRSSISRENQIKGSGLGLYLARRKAKLMGGALTVESPYERSDGKKRQGSRFILRIPYVTAEENRHHETNIDY